MGFFSALGESFSRQAIRTIKNFRNGRADIVSVQQAYKTLCICGRLFKDEREYGHNVARYYWVEKNWLENVHGQQIGIKSLSGNCCETEDYRSFVKVDNANEVTNIDFNLSYY